MALQLSVSQHLCLMWPVVTTCTVRHPKIRNALPHLVRGPVHIWFTSSSRMLPFSALRCELFRRRVQVLGLSLLLSTSQREKAEIISIRFLMQDGARMGRGYCSPGWRFCLSIQAGSFACCENCAVVLVHASTGTVTGGAAPSTSTSESPVRGPRNRNRSST